jgi:hypothetical protein
MNIHKVIEEKFISSLIWCDDCCNIIRFFFSNFTIYIFIHSHFFTSWLLNGCFRKTLVFVICRWVKRISWTTKTIFPSKKHHEFFGYFENLGTFQLELSFSILRSLTLKKLAMKLQFSTKSRFDLIVHCFNYVFKRFLFIHCYSFIIKNDVLCGLKSFKFFPFKCVM